MQTKKRIEIEIMRIIAAFGVIFNHTGENGFLLFQHCDPGSMLYWLYLSITVLCKIAVPLFFMISGALLLNREITSYREHLVHRVGRMLFLLIFWSFFYYMIFVINGGEDFRLSRFFLGLYSSSWNGYYWFLYAYLAVLLSIPLLQRLAQSLTNRDYLYLFALYGFFEILLPTLEVIFGKNTHQLVISANPLWLSPYLVVYPLTGYYLAHRIKDVWNGKRIGLLCIGSVFSLLIAVYMAHIRRVYCLTGGGEEIQPHEYILILAGTAFVMIQYFFRDRKLPEKIQKVICTIGSCTFGIYLLQQMFIGHPVFSAYLWGILWQRLHLPEMPAAFVFCAVIFLITGAITWVMQRIPYVRRLIQ